MSALLSCCLGARALACRATVWAHATIAIEEPKNTYGRRFNPLHPMTLCSAVMQLTYNEDLYVVTADCHLNLHTSF